jgi:flagellar export protein FliJ
MAAFHFRLETLLQIRENERDERRSRLAEAQRADDLIGERIGELDGELDRLRADAANRSKPGPMNVDALVEIQRYELLLMAERKASQEQRKLVAEEVERRREALVAADREVRVLVRLREKQQTRHLHEQGRLEQKVLDEIAMQGFAKREP